MNEYLKYPFDPQLILKKRKSIKREISESGIFFVDKKIAILGGSTTHDIRDMLELFLLNEGIRPTFFESEFGQYWQDVIFDNPELIKLKPDIVFIHTSNRNITDFPTVNSSLEEINIMLDNQCNQFISLWNKITEQYNCPIIQNNFELPFYRLLGNKDVSDFRGRTNFIGRLNEKFYEYAQNHQNFHINDINYLSASYGLEKWSAPLDWHMYKYCLCLDAIPYFSFNVSNIIKSIYGKNKKAFVLDLDNTLWGGVVGDDGVAGIEIGPETAIGQVYSEAQEYLKAYKDLGIMLNINSKNDYENAIAGLNHPEGILKPDDFIIIKANWQNKDQNIREIASELNIGFDSLVFIDDNPVEREIVTKQIAGVIAPDIEKVENLINIIDKSGFFEVTSISEDDVKRNEMYKVNIERFNQQQSFANYDDYLKSLKMTAIIRDFESVYLSRITQLTNKSNQFNLTTKRYSESDMEAVVADEQYIRLYGKLFDKFGDNGVVSVVIGKIDNEVLHIELWLMSCRVLKRNLEYAMMDRLIEESKKRAIQTVKGYYYKTAKNNMVKDFYEQFGYIKIGESDNGDSVWGLHVSDYINKNNVIKVEK
jgi:FkbH-like protein